ncbi:V-type H(+)-translocating pyrophosphatase [Candidatus Gromoviella agglomerans]|uniref:V-type H(+)-translocating pyrophosphatase n=1 Tax=Candidatus Gromoviella agglomerans TaxID=2806609 RepID=UPI001E3E9EE2|nr:V-type H(+)-translocating pyrophosphatase [Candidatus Gromoviella agglomerans]UFX98530.1 Sodium/proton-translocating pyrophosphatase [Candidatus Gromoviella agglomerans]
MTLIPEQFGFFSSLPDKCIFFLVFCSFLALFYAVFMTKRVIKNVQIDMRIRTIFEAIKSGAESFLRRQYRSIFLVFIILEILFFPFWKWYGAFGFFLGSFLSGLCGYVGMSCSVRANVRTAIAAQNGLSSAFSVAFGGGSITGFLVVGLGLFGLLGCYFVVQMFTGKATELIKCFISFAFGASLISIFAKLGGGIFTKAADVGADLVGKIDSNLEEDDARNPAVIADNVGDNVGDCAGMAGDMFQTYVATIIGTIYLAYCIFSQEDYLVMFFYTLAISGVSIPACIIGCMMFKVKSGDNIMNKMYKILFLSAFLSMMGMVLVTCYFLNVDSSLYMSDNIDCVKLLQCCFIGLLTGVSIFGITHYYTDSSYRPVKSISNSYISGAGTGIIQGIGMGLEACGLPALVIAISILLSYISYGLVGIGIASVAMLSISATVIAMDAYGPITDNAGGIAEMSSMGESVRAITDEMDAIGNTTKAVTKGYAVASSLFAGVVLFSAFVESIKIFRVNDSIDDASVVSTIFLVGAIVGAIVVCLFSSMSMISVSKVGRVIVLEVKRQFANGKIMSGEAKPDYSAAVDILTKESIKEMIMPSMLIFTPLLLYVVLTNCLPCFFSFDFCSMQFLSGLMIGATLVGFVLSIFMTSSGGAFDNAKKHIKSGRFLYDNRLISFSDLHNASVIGDIIGDPMKDTSGPSINPMVKALSILCLMIVLFL